MSARGAGPRAARRPIRIRAIAAAETLPLRGAVLRPGRPLPDAVFEGDEAASTRHLGAFRGTDLVAVVSSFDRPCPTDPSAPARQLRGMATLPGFRRQGIGAALLEEAVRDGHRGGVRLLWCNARRVAVAFWIAAGFAATGPEFEIEGVGPHRRMLRELSA